MKNVLRILAFAVVALALVYAPAAKADTLKPCELSTCTFALTASGTGVSINLNLIGTPLSNDKNPNYGITGATGTVVIGTTSYSNVSLYPDPGGPGYNETAPPTGILTYDNKLLGSNKANYLDTNGLLLEIPGLSESKKVKKVLTTSDYWVLEWHANGGGYYELQNSLVTADVYRLETLTATSTPEPVTLLLFGTGLMGIGGMVRRKLNR